MFESFNEGTTKDQTLEKVGTLVAVMGGLAIMLWITAYLMHSNLTKGSLLVVRRIKKAYLDAVLKQESAWFDMSNYTELSTRMAAECKSIEVGIGQKYG